MDRVRDLGWKLAVGGIVSAVLGTLILVVLAAIEMAVDPSLSLVDGYWVGRLPWTAIGIELVVVGSTIAVVAALIGSWPGGRWAARIVAAPAALIAGFWWAIALMPPSGGAPCTECGPHVADPITYAYSLPEGAVLLLILPAIVATVVAVLARPRADISTQAGVASPAPS